MKTVDFDISLDRFFVLLDLIDQPLLNVALDLSPCLIAQNESKKIRLNILQFSYLIILRKFASTSSSQGLMNMTI